MNAPPQRVDSLPVHPKVLAAAEKAGLQTVECVLHYSEGDLVRRTGLLLGEVRALVQLASEALLPSPALCPALDLYVRGRELLHWGRLSLGCPVIDGLLRGGILVPGLTELAGTSAAGKTQLCLQLCLTVQLPRQHGGLGGGAVYVSTEDAFPTKRLQQLVERFAAGRGLLSHQQLTDAIFVEHSATTSAMNTLLRFKLPSLFQYHPSIKLVVIDSMAALFRVEFSSTQLVQRAQLLRTFGAQLQRIASHYDVAVVCTNQVTADLGDASGMGMRPALGLAWADMIGTRLLLHRNESVDADEGEGPQLCRPVPRRLMVRLAPHLPPHSLHYYIDQDGVHGIPHTNGDHE